MIWALHGNLGDPGDWAKTVDPLAPLAIRTISLWERPPESFAKWTKSFFAGLEAESGHRVLMGYSLGARLAMHALLDRPERWTAAIFVSGHPGLGREEERVQRLRNDLAWAERLRAGTVEEFAQAWNAQAVFDGEPPSTRQIEVLSKHREAIAAAFDCWSLGRQEDLGAKLRDCPVPQLWVAGERDPKFAALTEGMAEQAKHVSAVILKECGHRVPLQKPRELAECVRAFLERVT